MRAGAARQGPVHHSLPALHRPCGGGGRRWNQHNGIIVAGFFTAVRCTGIIPAVFFDILIGVAAVGRPPVTCGCESAAYPAFTPSPPRSGGEGWGEVARLFVPSLAARAFGSIIGVSRLFPLIPVYSHIKRGGGGV